MTPNTFSYIKALNRDAVNVTINYKNKMLLGNARLNLLKGLNLNMKDMHKQLIFTIWLLFCDVMVMNLSHLIRFGSTAQLE